MVVVSCLIRVGRQARWVLTSIHISFCSWLRITPRSRLFSRTRSTTLRRLMSLLPQAKPWCYGCSWLRASPSSKGPCGIDCPPFHAEMAALEAEIGSVDSEKAVPKNEWPHVTIWTGEKMAAKEANRLPQLLL
uniref:tRNA ligase phosphodiesterase domain-containing protein n=1 Tax=Populus trichocarpa TaxID=3694 RepID=A0A3N7FYW3_POPTR